MLKSVDELRKEMTVSDEFLKKVIRKINQFKNQGKMVICCGSYSCNNAELNLTTDTLSEKGYRCSFGSNSHGVTTLIVTW